MRFCAVIFDLDGTLVEFRFDVVAAKNAMINELAHLGFDISDLSTKDSTQKIFDKVEEQIKQNAKNTSYYDVRSKLCDILDNYEVEALGKSKLFPETKKVLTLLRNSGLRLGLVTNSGRYPTMLAINSHNIKDTFEVIITRNEVSKLKPSGEGISKALSKLCVEESKTLYVGDSILDIMAAREAGIKIVSVTGGVHSIDVLKNSSPDFLVNSLEDVVKLVL